VSKCVIQTDRHGPALADLSISESLGLSVGSGAGPLTTLHGRSKGPLPGHGTGEGEPLLSGGEPGSHNGSKLKLILVSQPVRNMVMTMVHTISTPTVTQAKASF
jgi:hypothetical protein